VTDLGILPHIAAIGMSLAGFAGLISALLRGPGEWRPFDVIAIRAQVSYGFATVLLALVPIPLAGIVGADAALRSAGIVLLIFSIGWGYIGSRDSRRAKLPLRRRLPFIAISPVQIAAAIWAVVDPRLAVYELALISLLAYAMPVFFIALVEGRGRAAELPDAGD
jgi:hypothetical protein